MSGIGEERRERERVQADRVEELVAELRALDHSIREATRRPLIELLEAQAAEIRGLEARAEWAEELLAAGLPFIEAEVGPYSPATAEDFDETDPRAILADRIRGIVKTKETADVD